MKFSLTAFLSLLLFSHQPSQTIGQSIDRDLQDIQLANEGGSSQNQSFARILANNDEIVPFGHRDGFPSISPLAITPNPTTISSSSSSSPSSSSSTSGCAKFLGCERQLMAVHRRCTERSRKAIADRCSMEREFKDLQMLNEERMAAFGQCLLALEANGTTAKKEGGNGRRGGGMNCAGEETQSQNGHPATDGCWMELSELKKQCHSTEQCCPWAKECLQLVGQSAPSLALRRQHRLINRKTLMCRDEQQQKQRKQRRERGPTREKDLLPNTLKMDKFIGRLDYLERLLNALKQRMAPQMPMPAWMRRLAERAGRPSQFMADHQPKGIFPATRQIQQERKVAAAVQQLIGHKLSQAHALPTNLDLRRLRLFAARPRLAQKFGIMEKRRQTLMKGIGGQQMDAFGREMPRAKAFGAKTAKAEMEKQQQQLFQQQEEQLILPIIESITATTMGPAERTTIEITQNGLKHQIPSEINEWREEEKMAAIPGGGNPTKEFPSTSMPENQMIMGMGMGMTAAATTTTTIITTATEKITKTVPMPATIIPSFFSSFPIATVKTTIKIPSSSSPIFLPPSPPSSTPSAAAFGVPSFSANAQRVFPQIWTIRSTSKVPMDDQQIGAPNAGEEEGSSKTTLPIPTRAPQKISKERENGLPGIWEDIDAAEREGITAENEEEKLWLPMEGPKRIGTTNKLVLFGRTEGQGGIEEERRKKPAKGQQKQGEKKKQKKKKEKITTKTITAPKTTATKSTAHGPQMNGASKKELQRKRVEITLKGNRQKWAAQQKGYRGKVLLLGTTIKKGAGTRKVHAGMAKPRQPLVKNDDVLLPFADGPSLPILPKMPSEIRRSPTAKFVAPSSNNSLPLQLKNGWAELEQLRRALVRQLERFMADNEEEKKRQQQQQQPFWPNSQSFSMLNHTKKDSDTLGLSLDHCRLFATCQSQLANLQHSGQCPSSLASSSSNHQGRLVPGPPRRRFGRCNARLLPLFERIDMERAELEKRTEMCLAQELAKGTQKTKPECPPNDWPLLPPFSPQMDCPERISLLHQHCRKLGRCCATLESCQREVAQTEMAENVRIGEERLARRSAKCQMQAHEMFKERRRKGTKTIKRAKDAKKMDGEEEWTRMRRRLM